MKTRFRKIWCAQCSSMQFAGECGHGLFVDVDPKLRLVLAAVAERTPPYHRAEAVDVAMRGIAAGTLHPNPAIWKLYQ